MGLLGDLLKIVVDIGYTGLESEYRRSQRDYRDNDDASRERYQKARDAFESTSELLSEVEALRGNYDNADFYSRQIEKKRNDYLEYKEEQHMYKK